MTPITEKDKVKIIDLYYNHMYNYAELEKYFKYKYKEAQLRTVITDSYKNYKGGMITRMPPKKKKIK